MSTKGTLFHSATIELYEETTIPITNFNKDLGWRKYLLIDPKEPWKTDGIDFTFTRLNISFSAYVIDSIHVDEYGTEVTIDYCDNQFCKPIETLVNGLKNCKL